MSEPFRYSYYIGLHDTDAAGLIFFANIHRITHQAYEAFLRQIGFGMDKLFEQRTMAMPVVHLEADFQQMLTAGRHVEILCRVAHLGKSSYRMAYEVRDDTGALCATAATVQVCISPKTREPMDIPEEFRTALEKWLA
jgi:1,4-dihydroxy-2-naphthoyl-CoA hydrolase